MTTKTTPLQNSNNTNSEKIQITKILNATCKGLGDAELLVNVFNVQSYCELELNLLQALLKLVKVKSESLIRPWLLSSNFFSRGYGARIVQIKFLANKSIPLRYSKKTRYSAIIWGRISSRIGGYNIQLRLDLGYMILRFASRTTCVGNQLCWNLVQMG